VDATDADYQVRHFPADDDENYLALDNYNEHSCNAITTEATVFYAIDRAHLDLLMTWTQAAEALLDDDEEADNRDWMDAMLASGLFSQIPPGKIQALFTRFAEREVELGETVIREGDTAETFYVIKEGKAMITRSDGGREQTLAALGAGQFFGEDALIAQSPRNATVTMTSDGTLMCLDQDAFRELLQETVIQQVTHAQMREMMEDGDKACVHLDVRLPMEFKHDRKPGARNIPLGELRRQLRQLEKEFVYVVSCDGGGRSQLGCYLLNEAGFEAYALEQSPREPEQAEPESDAEAD